MIKLLTIFNLGRIYKYNLDSFIKKNEEIIMERKKKQSIALMRRQPIKYISLKDKMLFFKQVHQVLNKPIKKKAKSKSNINPVIINNFYDYAMTNEKKNYDKQESLKTTNIDNLISRINTTSTLVPALSNAVELNNTLKDSNNVLLLKENRRYMDDTEINTNNNQAVYKRNSLFIMNKNFNLNNVIIEKKKEEYDSSCSDSNYSSDSNNDEEDNVGSNNVITFCDCEKSSKKDFKNRFSLLSPQILSKINQGKGSSKDVVSNTKPHINAEINHNILNEYLAEKRRNSLYLSDNKHTADALSQAKTKHKQHVMFNQPIFFKGLINEDKLDRRLSKISHMSSRRASTLLCDKCAGLFIYNQNLNDSVNTYMPADDVDILSRRSSSDLITSNQVSSSFTTERKHARNSIFNSPSISSKDVVSYSLYNNSKDSKQNISAMNFLKMVEHRKKETKIKGDDKENDDNPIFRMNTNINTNSNCTSLKRASSLHLNNPYDLNFFRKNDTKEEKYHPKLSLKLSKLTTIRVVCLILFLLFLMPFFDKDIYYSFTEAYDFQLNLLSQYLESGNIDIFIKTVNRYILNDNLRNSTDPEIVAFGFLNYTTVEQFNLTQTYNHPDVYVSDYTYNHTRYIDRLYLNTTYLYIVYNAYDHNALKSTLNIFKILFIAGLLWASSFLFLQDINKLVIMPLETAFKSIRERKIGMENVYYNLDDIAKKDIQHLIDNHPEYYKIEKFYRQTSKMIIRTIGLRPFNYFKSRIFAEEDIKYNEKAFFSLKGIIMIIRTTNLDQLCIEHGENISMLYSNLIETIDHTAFEHFGEILKIEGDKIILFFDENQFKSENNINNNNSNIETSRDRTINTNNTKSNNHRSESSNINEDFHSFQIDSHKNDKSESEPELAFQVTSNNNESTHTANFAILSAIKILSRVYYNPKLKKMFKLNITMHKGNMNYFVTNTREKIETVLNGYTLNKAISIMSYTKGYNIPLVFSDNIYNELNKDMKNYIREIGHIDKSKIYSYDITFTKSHYKNPYIFNDLLLTKNSSLVNHKEFATMLTNGSFNLSYLLKTDSELLYIRSNDSITFIKLFKQGYIYYINKRYKKAAILLKNAAIFRPGDKICQFILSEMEKSEK